MTGHGEATVTVYTVSFGVIEYAIRYCMTRKSYAFDDGLDLAEKHWSRLSVATQTDVIDECVRRFDRPEQIPSRHQMIRRAVEVRLARS